MLRYIGYSLIYVFVYQLREHLSTTQFFIAIGLTTLCVFGLHRYLKKGDDKILRKVQASQDRYEHAQEMKAAEGKKKSELKGTDGE
ncbi:MAG: hypothetical protein ACI9KE_004803 [Polyangiales bacterium]|jgi:hypothetical protein